MSGRRHVIFNVEVALFVDDPGYDWQTDELWMEAPVEPLGLDGPEMNED